MVQFNFTYDPSVSLEQRIGFELAAAIWATYLTDDITVSLHIGSSDRLGADGNAVGGAVPMFYSQNYGVYQTYAEADATTSEAGEPATVDEQALASLQTGNTVDFVIDGEIVDGNSEILLTSAQAKALGMDNAIALENTTLWDRDLADTEGLDGYIIIGNQHEWSYDYTREGEAPEGTLDFLSMAMHEIGHTLGFFSGIDGSLDTIDLHSGETQVEEFSVLDLYRHSLNASSVENPDGAMSDLTIGENAYFSIDGGITSLANFATGILGDGYQASHWQRLEQALGIMDPTLAYRERLSISELDLQTMDVLGYDVNYAALDSELDLEALLLQAEAAVSQDVGIASVDLSEHRGNGEHGDRYSLSYSEWWQIIESQIRKMDNGEALLELFEIGYGSLFQAHEAQYSGEGNGRLFEIGYGSLFQIYEETIFELGYGSLFQSLEAEILELGYGSLFQLFELGYGMLFQALEPLFATLDYVENAENVIEAPTAVDFSNIPIFSGGENDDIIGGSAEQDRVEGGLGDDLIDGKAGDDMLVGNAGRDLIYGADGNDIVYGGDDDDRLLGEDGDDQLFGDEGHDIIAGGFGHDILAGGAGRDDIQGASGNDVVSGGAGDDLIDGGDSSDLLMGNEGADVLKGGAGNDIIYGDANLAQTQSALNILRQNLVREAITNPDANNPSASSNSDITDINGFIRIEAESMSQANGYITKTVGSASGDRLIETYESGVASALTNFSGPTGRYMVIVRYTDESDGQASASIKIGGETVDSWQFDQDNNQFISRTVATDIIIQNGDVIEILGLKDQGEHARIDYIDLIPLDTILTQSLNSSAPDSLLTNSDFEAGLEGWFDGTDISTVEDADANSRVLRLGSHGSGTGQNIAIDGGGLYTLTTQAKATGMGWSGFGIKFMDENWEALETRTYHVTGSEWATHGGTILASEEARFVNIWLHKNGDDGEFLLDDFSLVAGGGELSFAENKQTASIVKNGDFESELDGTNWGIWAGSGEISTLDAYEGRSLILSGENVSGGQTVDVKMGQVYQLSLDAKVANTGGWSGFGIAFYDINGDTIGGSSYEVTSETWRHYEQQVIVPKGAVAGGIWFSKPTVTGSLSIDNVVMTHVEDASVGASYPTSLENGLLAHFALDESLGESLTNRIGGENLILNQIDEGDRTAGKTGGGLYFEPGGGSIGISAAEQLQSGLTSDITDADFTFAMWIKPEAEPSGANRRVMSKWSSDRYMELWLDGNSNRIRFELSTNNSSDKGNMSQQSLATDEWNHVTYVKSGRQLSLYINGRLDSSITLQGDVLMPEGLIEVGKQFVGTIDDIYLYNRALSLTDIHSLSGYQADVLEGGLGSDQLFGDEGDDVLDGTDGVNLGYREKDVLSGGSGRDKFILGRAGSDYYLFDGDDGFATITDFEVGVDVLQLEGSSRNSYIWHQEGAHTRLSFGSDTIAVLENVSDFDPQDGSVIYVSDPSPNGNLFTIW